MTSSLSSFEGLPSQIVIIPTDRQNEYLISEDNITGFKTIKLNQEQTETTGTDKKIYEICKEIIETNKAQIEKEGGMTVKLNNGTYVIEQSTSQLSSKRAGITPIAIFRHLPGEQEGTTSAATSSSSPPTPTTPNTPDSTKDLLDKERFSILSTVSEGEEGPDEHTGLFKENRSSVTLSEGVKAEPSLVGSSLKTIFGEAPELPAGTKVGEGRLDEHRLDEKYLNSRALYETWAAAYVCDKVTGDSIPKKICASPISVPYCALINTMDLGISVVRIFTTPFETYHALTKLEDESASENVEKLRGVMKRLLMGKIEELPAFKKLLSEDQVSFREKIKKLQDEKQLLMEKKQSPDFKNLLAENEAALAEVPVLERENKRRRVHQFLALIIASPEYKNFARKLSAKNEFRALASVGLKILLFVPTVVVAPFGVMKAATQEHSKTASKFINLQTSDPITMLRDSLEKTSKKISDELTSLVRSVINPMVKDVLTKRQSRKA